jgi:DNA-binding CsgD family transcriptional regulator
MESLSDRDNQILHQCIQRIYAVRDFDAFRLEALSIIDRLVPNDFHGFYSTNIQTGETFNILWHNFGGITPEMETIIDRYYGEHPIVQNMPKTLTGVHKISDFIRQQEFHALEGLYQQYLGVFGIEDQMVFFLPPHHDRDLQFAEPDLSLHGFALHRPRRNFTERDRQILNLLIPHLSQASANVRYYQQLQQNLALTQQSLDRLGSIVLAGDGRIVSIASQSEIWLEIYFDKTNFPLELPDNLWSWVKNQIAYLSDSSDSSKACLPLRIQQGGRELTIRLVIEVIEERYLLLLEEQALSSLNSLAILGLSQRETEVFFWVMRGKDNKTIATKLNINIGTVGSHLENIYRRWSVQSRTEAISLALDKLGFSYFLPSG